MTRMCAHRTTITAGISEDDLGDLVPQRPGGGTGLRECTIGIEPPLRGESAACGAHTDRQVCVGFRQFLGERRPE